MVSFSCESCGDVLTKSKLDKHVGRCRGASFTCLDCSVHFPGSSYKSHTSCMTEAQKYEGSYKRERERRHNNSQGSAHGKGHAMIPKKAYVEDEGDTEMAEAVAGDNAILPAAPSPPRRGDGDLPPGTNVYDFLVKEDGKPPSQALALADATNDHASGISDDSHFAKHGYSYGNTPLPPTLSRFDSYSSLVPRTGDSQSQDDSQRSAYLTPAPHRTTSGLTDSRSEKKRKRSGTVDTKHVRYAEEDALAYMSANGVRPPLHSGLTGGLNRLLSRPVDEFEKQAGTLKSPVSPVKRSKRGVDGEVTDRDRDRRRDDERRSEARGRDHARRDGDKKRRNASSSSEEGGGTRRGQKAIEYKKGGDEANASKGDSQELVRYRNPAEHFLSFITKGTDSERGQSINKILKRYHREQRERGEHDRDAVDKDLWKELRVRRNENGEIVLFM